MADGLVSTAVEEALTNLKGAVLGAIRAEQLRDRLTNLANDEALTEWTQNVIDEGVEFWAAFIEVDRFKSINDKFGYDDADILLQRIGRQLHVAAADFFPSGAVPVRAHGDEFFLVGNLQPTLFNDSALAEALDNVRRSISAIRVKHRENPEPMCCTVSIGWLLSSDALELKSGLTTRSVRGALELAVAKAKSTRDCVVRFVPSMTRSEVADGRADCSKCGAKFSLTIPLPYLSTEDLWCPSCGTRLGRPVALQGPNSPPTQASEDTADNHPAATPQRSN